MNFNIVYGFVILAEVGVILFLALRMFFRNYRTRDNIKDSLLHATSIVLIAFYLGHLVSVSTLYSYHFRTIQTFKNRMNDIPEADRINGRWILDDKDFMLNKSERAILTNNYNKLSPCYFDRGYCYFELGGFLNNSGGYCLKIDQNTDGVNSFGFHRIDTMKKIVGNWMYYE